jgi:hypothetical protein
MQTYPILYPANFSKTTNSTMREIEDLGSYFDLRFGRLLILCLTTISTALQG